MKTFELSGTLRTELGKKSSNTIRNNDSIPCVLYGGAEVVHFTTTNGDIRKLVYSPDVYLVNLTVDGKTTKAILKELQLHPVTDKILHIDFFEVTDNKPITVGIPVKLEGLAEGVKAGGKLSLEMRKLKVKGLYQDIPESIGLNVSDLGLGKTIQVANITLANLQVLNAKNAVVAQVKLTRAARGAAAAESK